ncbi:terminase [Vibrio harveyi]|uniref:terminase n=1 Tax=Vibrio harveyi TaxID=669 RepID=UPI0025AFF84E|nr:terminase [Vibrio harveyi]WJT09273.1 terminase [Vibrio harveyi]
MSLSAFDPNFKALTDTQFRALSKTAKKDYFRLYLGNKEWRLNNLYKIENEDGEVVTFKMRDAQKELFDTAMPFEIILKARQLGFSTYIDIYILDSALFNNNYKAGIQAQTSKHAGEIFNSKILFPYDHLPGYIRSRRTVKQRSGGVDSGSITFNNDSRIRVSTSFRSGTLQFLHISELGKICSEGGEKKANEVKTGSLPTVHAGSKCVIESTAEGASGFFYDLSMLAQEQQQAGIPLGPRDFNFRFIPWFTHPKYKAKVRGDKLKQSAYYKNYFAQVEKATGVTLSPERRQWYMDTARTQGEHMKQEFPSTPLEAFLTSGRRVFDSVQCMAAEKRCSKPLLIYSIDPETGKMTDVRADVNTNATGAELIKGLKDYLLIWELPQKDQDYAIGADVAEGLEHGDRSSLDVLNARGDQVGHWFGNADTDEFAKIIAHVGEMYNTAYVGPERNNHGHAVLSKLREIYPTSRIYTEEYHDRDDDREETQRLGWLTTKSSKPIIIEGLKEDLRHEVDGIQWIGTIQEMNTYVYDKKGSTNAMDGSFDDQVMSYAIAREMLARMPRTTRKTEARQRPGDYRKH